MENILTFWQLLDDNRRIIIPALQRDYAQGRTQHMVKIIRENFLTDLKDVLSKSDGKSLKLDFIYGAKKSGGIICPLDGQQRLTTLYLIHWYLGSRFSPQDLGRLKNFSYETRTSSRRFCEMLCNLSATEIATKANALSMYITNQSSFRSTWLYDPTISGMLVMLDAIHAHFHELGESAWTRLVKDGCIRFDYLDLEDFCGTDELYIKMNARGRALTDFENFKAKLIQYAHKTLPNKGELVTTIEYAMDTTWMDIMWKHKVQDYPIDKIYLEFFNRYFLNELIISHEKPEETTLYKSLITENDQNFSDFSVYHDAITEESLEKLKKIMDNFSAIPDPPLLSAPWEESSVPLIPRLNSGELERITQLQRSVLYGVFQFLQHSRISDNNEAFDSWMRIVWNLSFNAGSQSMTKVMKLIDSFSEHCLDVNNYLLDVIAKEHIEKNDLGYQLREEIEKLQQMKNERWRERILDAEKHSLFCGRIRFLYERYTNEYEFDNADIEWEQFDMMWEKLSEAFPLHKEQNINDNILKLLSTFIAKFKCHHYLYHEEIFNTKTSNWRNLLQKNNYKFDLYQLVRHDLQYFIDNDEELCKKNYKYLREEIDKSGIIPYLVEREPRARIRIKGPYWGFVKSKGTHNFITSFDYLEGNDEDWHSNRNAVLRHLLDIDKHPDFKAHESHTYLGKERHLFIGDDIHFLYKEVCYVWTRNNDIALENYSKRKAFRDNSTDLPTNLPSACEHLKNILNEFIP